MYGKKCTKDIIKNDCHSKVTIIIISYNDNNVLNWCKTINNKQCNINA